MADRSGGGEALLDEVAAGSQGQRRAEFGRTPKVNGTGGRDHYPKVFSIVMAGGGIKQGLIHGATDVTGTEVDSDPLTVPDYAATIYRLLGIDWEKTLMAGARPVSGGVAGIGP